MVSLASKVIGKISRASVRRKYESLISIEIFFATSVLNAPSVLGHYNTVVPMLVPFGYSSSMFLDRIHILVVVLAFVWAVVIVIFFYRHLKFRFLGANVDDC